MRAKKKGGKTEKKEKNEKKEKKKKGKLKDSAFCPASQQKREQPKKTPRLLRSFAQSRVVTEKVRGDQPLIPGMSPYSDDVDMDAGTADYPRNKKLSLESDVESLV